LSSGAFYTCILRSVLLAKQPACDPLPSLTTLSEYNDTFFAGAEEIFSVRPRRRDVERWSSSSLTQASGCKWKRCSMTCSAVAW